MQVSWRILQLSMRSTFVILYEDDGGGVGRKVHFHSPDGDGSRPAFDGSVWGEAL